MDMSGTDNSSMLMSMTFSENKNTPLWLQEFTPVTDADYVGTIIGLILLGITNRGISTGRYLYAKYSLGRIEVMADLNGKRQSSSEAEELSTMALSAPNFKWRYDIPRTIIAGVEAFTGYLLMLAVMTVDVGYFFAVIGGIMMGELVFGRYSLGISVVGHIH